EDVDYRWTGGAPKLSQAQTYSGYTALSPHAIRQLQDRLRKYNRDKADQDLSSVITQLDLMPVLGQALGGLGDAFLMRDQCLQIAAIHPGIFAGKTETQRDPIIELVR